MDIVVRKVERLDGGRSVSVELLFLVVQVQAVSRVVAFVRWSQRVFNLW